ncbi:MAG: YfcC family protein [Acidobacteria bacterium]|nr:MAG: YfcC family protein [Acidobacteriota bacterium]
MARVAAPQSEPDDVSRADHERPGDRRQRSPRVPARRLSGDARRRRAVARRRSIHARARRRRVEDRDRRLHVDAPQVIAFRLPNPSVLLLSGVLVAAALTWVLPAGQYDRRDDAATGRRVAVPGTYHSVPRAPVGLFAAAVAVPRGFVAAADVIAVIFFVGGAWFIVDRLGTLPAVVGGLVRTFGDRGLYIIPVVSAFFGVMGAVENMQEEIIPLIPVLLVLGRGLGVDAVVVVSMSMGAAMVGSAFGPTNPFQAGIAMKLAQLPLFAAGRLRLAMFARAESARAEARGFQPSEPPAADATWHPRHALILAIVVAPIGAYVYGALRLDWGFNELSGAFLIAAIAAGLAGGLSLTATVVTYIEGMREVVSAALMIGIARSISLVLDDGHVIDTILYALASALTAAPKTVAALLMVPSQALIHIPVPSVSGHAMLTVPVFVALGDLLGMSRQVPVLAYQTGAGLMELLTPTNGALMAILLAAGVPYQRWVRFTVGGVLLLAAIGILAIAVVLRFP